MKFPKKGKGNRASLAVFFLVLMLNAAFALDFETKWYPVRCTTQPGGTCTVEDRATSYLKSDIQSSPAISLSSSRICAGGSVQVSFNAPTTWNTLNSVDAATSHGAVNTGQLYSTYANSPGPFAVRFITGSQSDSLYNSLNSPTIPIGRSFYYGGSGTDAMWENFLSAQGLAGYPEYEYGAKYKSTTSSTYWGTYKAKVGLFCNARAVVKFNGAVKVDQEYSGAQLSAPVSGLPAGQYTITSQLDLPRCQAAIRTYSNSVHQYVIVQSTQSQLSIQGGQQTLSVENPFVCALLPISNQFVSNSNPAAGSNVNFGFRLTNNLDREIQVTGITLSPSSVSQGFSLVGAIVPVPSNIPATGTNYKDFTGTLKVPLTTGAKSIKMDIVYRPTSADCAGGQPNCPMAETQVISITVQPPAPQPDYTPSIAPLPLVYVGEQFQSQITTRNIGGACAQANSFTNATFPYPSGSTARLSVLPLCPPPQMPSSSSSAASFSCPSTAGAYTLLAYADADGVITESSESNNNASASLYCSPKPDSCVISVAGGNANFGTPDSGIFSAACTYLGSSVFCPALAWSHTAAGNVQLNPTSTPRAFSPQSTLTISSGVSTQLDREVRASSSEPAITLVCNPAKFNITAPILPASSCELAYVGHDGNVTTGANWTFQARCRDQTGQIASCPSLSWLTNVTGGSMVAPSTPSQASPRSNLSIPQNAPSPQSGWVNASAASFSCRLPVRVLPSNLRISCGLELGHSPVFFPGESAWANATCYSGATRVPCPVLLWSTQDLYQVTLAPSRTASEPHRSLVSVAYSATAPQSGAILVQCENAAQCINTCSAGVNVSKIPVRMDCSLLNHSSLFAPGDWALVQANCTDAQSQVTACPALSWLTRNQPIIGGSFNPNPTQAMLRPTTNFSVSPDAPINQNGLIDAVSSNPLIPGLMCRAAIGISVNDIGTDYNLTDINTNPKNVLVGQKVKIDVEVQNIGNVNATNWTSTRITGANCVPSQQDKSLKPLDVGESFTHFDFECTCAQAGWNTFTAEANVNRNQYETTYANNKKDGQYYCKIVTQLTCADFV